MHRFFAFCVAAICCPLGAAAVAVASLSRTESDPSYLASVECSNKVSRLSDETNRLLVQHQKIDSQCADAMRYYKDMIVSVDKSIAHLKSSSDAQDSDEQLKEEYRQRYTGMMCTKTYEAFFLNDKDARIEVLEICMGRKSLAPPSSFLRHRARLDQGGSCPQADAMQKRVDTLRTSLSTKAAECRAKKMKLRSELNEKRATEDKLEDKYYGHHSNKAQLKSQVANEVESKFCAVIQSNYKLSEENIKKFWVDECPA